MKNVIFGLFCGFVLTTHAAAAETCKAAAEKAAKAVYSVSNRSKVEVSSVFTGTTQNEAFDVSVESYSVTLEERGGSGIYVVQAVPSLDCLISKVEIESID